MKNVSTDLKAENAVLVLKILKTNVFPAEATVDPEPFFVVMGKRKIRVEEQFTETKKFS